VSDAVDVFAYLDYRRFIADFVAWKKATRGLTYRSFAERSGLSSPNYLQQVVRGKRNVTAPTAAKIAAGLGLTGHAKAFFSELVELAGARTDAAQALVLQKLKARTAKAKRQPLTAPSLHSSWLHAVVWETAALDGGRFDAEALAARLRYVANAAEVGASLRFLVERGWLAHDAEAGVYRQQPVAFEPLNDVRRLEIQQCHLKYLEIAKRRVADPVAEREYQALTLAVPRSRMADVKQRLRAFIASLNDELAEEDGADSIVQLTCAAFFLTGPSD
jgi:uncharacterized protein (TIGR02147 family)